MAHNLSLIHISDLLITVTYKVDNLNNTGIAVTEFEPRPAS